MNATTLSLFALLLAGHALGDFAIQTDRMVADKTAAAALIRHVAAVTVCQLVALLPYMRLPALAIVGGLGLAHLAIDYIKEKVASDRGLSLTVFVFDQAAHLSTLFAALWLLSIHARPKPMILSPETLSQVGFLVAGYAFNIYGGAAIVSGVLSGCRVNEAEQESTTGHGRLIGILERLLALTLVLVAQWGALGLLVAAKSIARFKELDEQEFSEYYLIGTLTSLLVAVSTGVIIVLLT